METNRSEPAILLKPMSSLEKCFLDENILYKRCTDRFTLFRGQPLAFQVAVARGDTGLPLKVLLPVSLSGVLAPYATARVAVSVPVHYPTLPLESPAPYLRTSPGLYPDLLRPLHYDGQLPLTAGQTQVLWICAELPDDLPAGEYPLTVSVGPASVTVSVRVLSHALPPQKLIHTEWFYTDCLADFYRVPVFSEEHWRIIGNFISTAVKNGINMILTPVFTPELDTRIGGERTTTQLVEIRVEAPGQYAFDFSLLGRWIDLCLSLGVRYFEIPHFFSQWGATATPKFMAWESGTLRQIFGWETDALGEEYGTFLSQFIPALVGYLREKGVEKQTYFHVSDEPHTEHLDHYKACKERIEKDLQGLPILDALSDYGFYESGACPNPVPHIKHITPFLEHHVPGLWAYYCGATGQYHMTGRMLAQPLRDTRILGAQLWNHRIEGFLHWGYNFWNTQNSYDRIDPFQTTDGDYFAPSGDTILVYPGTGGTAWESMRLNAMREAMEDFRMLTLCEELRGREFTEALLREVTGAELTFFTLPDASFYTRLRDRIAEAIGET